MEGDREFLESLQSVDQALAGQGAGAESLAGVDLCGVYNKIKGPLGIIIPIVERIPLYGKTIASALRLLQQFGDQYCPA